MDIEKLIEQLKSAAGGPEGIKMCHAAATQQRAADTVRLVPIRPTIEFWRKAVLHLPGSEAYFGRRGNIKHDKSGIRRFFDLSPGDGTADAHGGAVGTGG